MSINTIEISSELLNKTFSQKGIKKLYFDKRKNMVRVASAAKMILYRNSKKEELINYFYEVDLLNIINYNEDQKNNFYRNVSLIIDSYQLNEGFKERVRNLQLNDLIAFILKEKESFYLIINQEEKLVLQNIIENEIKFDDKLNGFLFILYKNSSLKTLNNLEGILSKYNLINDLLTNEINLLKRYKQIDDFNSKVIKNFEETIQLSKNSLPLMFGSPKDVGYDVPAFFNKIFNKVSLVINAMQKDQDLEANENNIINSSEDFKIIDQYSSKDNFIVTIYSYLKNQEAPFVIHLDGLSERTSFMSEKEGIQFIKSICQILKIIDTLKIKNLPLLIHCRQGLQRTSVIAVLFTILWEGKHLKKINQDILKDLIVEYSIKLSNEAASNGMGQRLMSIDLFYSITRPYFLNELMNCIGEKK